MRVLFCVWFFLLAALASAQQDKLQVYIFAEMGASVG
jgi:hypothetical protein